MAKENTSQVTDVNSENKSSKGPSYFIDANEPATTRDILVASAALLMVISPLLAKAICLWLG